MRPKTLQRRLYTSAVLSPGRFDVEKQETGNAASCGPGTEKLASESAAKARSGVLGGNNQDEQGCDSSGGNDNGPRDGAAGVEPARERRNLGERRPVP